MGGGSYNVVSRSKRAETSSYYTATFDALSTNTREKKMDSLMNPMNVVRECRDNADHPNSVPLLLVLDGTGSMRSVPQDFIRDGLPTMMKTLYDAGLQDVAVCFSCVGDHVYDRFPFQVGQFEADDQKLDQWLISTCIESGGGSNEGESYGLAWAFAINQIQSDAWEKRRQKGIIITIGDEPNLKSYPSGKLNHILGGQQNDESDKSLLLKVQEKWEVFHIDLNHRNASENRDSAQYWINMLGQRAITDLRNYQDIPKRVAEICRSVIKSGSDSSAPISTVVDTPEKMML